MKKLKKQNTSTQVLCAEMQEATTLPFDDAEEEKFVDEEEEEFVDQEEESVGAEEEEFVDEEKELIHGEEKKLMDAYASFAEMDSGIALPLDVEIRLVRCGVAALKERHVYLGDELVCRVTALEEKYIYIEKRLDQHKGYCKGMFGAVNQFVAGFAGGESGGPNGRKRARI